MIVAAETTQLYSTQKSFPEFLSSVQNENSGHEKVFFCLSEEYIFLRGLTNPKNDLPM